VPTGPTIGPVAPERGRDLAPEGTYFLWLRPVLALALLEPGEDPKYREKYSGLWKDLAASKRG
jgi:hypothetical protein